MARLAAIQRSLPEDWPEWAARIVSDEAPLFAAELAKPWSDEDVVVEAALRSIEKQLARELKKGDVAAEEQWWDRLDAWLDGLDGSIGQEALHAMTSWDEARYAKNPRVYHGSPYEFGTSEFRRSEHGLYGPGVYFTDNKEDAEWYATKFEELGHIYTCDVELENPLEWHRYQQPTDVAYSSWAQTTAYPYELSEEIRRIFNNPKDRAAKLMGLGFDGVVVHFHRGGSKSYPNLEVVSSPEAATETYYIVLDPEDVSGCTVEPVERRRMTANGEDYRGEHRAPGKEAAPLWDLTANGVYPDDVYGPRGPQYYGIGDNSDSRAWGIVSASRGKPKKAIKIYRSVPRAAAASERIADLEAQKRHILKHGTIPKGVTTYQTPSAYYEMIHRSLDSLREQAEREGHASEAPIQINPGDWVTIDRKYAVDHGEASLGGKGNYVVLSKTVPASALFTDGNSILEWGYDP